MASYILTFGETPDERCTRCGAETVLVTADHWYTHYPDKTGPKPDEDDGYCEPEGETSGHWCPRCNVLTAVFIHTPARSDHDAL